MRGALLLFLAGAIACSTGETAGDRCVPTRDGGIQPLACAGGGTVPGIDVSAYQGAIDWTSVRSAGIAFAVARVSDGTGFPDAMFAKNWQDMKAAGVARGAYQFFRPEEDPTAQANLFVSMLSAAGGFDASDLSPTMDVEVTDSVDDVELRFRMQTWLDAMQAAMGQQPLIYMPLDLASHVGTGFAAYPLWVANWGVACPAIPAGWRSWDLWQFSSTGSVAGIRGVVDLDEANGSLGNLLGPTQSPSSDAGLPWLPDGGLATPGEAGPGAAASPVGDAGSVMGGRGGNAPCVP